MQAIQSRRTIRRFKQIPVTNDQINALIDSAIMAPSAKNGQLLRYFAVSSKEKLREVFRNTAWGGYVHPKRIPLSEVSSPMLFIVVAAVKNEAGTVTHHTWADAGAAIENMLLTAVDLGLGGCWIGSFDPAILQESLPVPESLMPLYITAFGVPDESPVMERIGADGSTKYYLDPEDQLHVPKYTVESVTTYL
jgi:nitroreductase